MDSRTHLRVLLVYSEADEDLALRLLKHLSVLVRFSGVDTWTEDRIQPGADAQVEFAKAIQHADIGLLLISASFLASPTINEATIPQIINRHREGMIHVVPVLLKSCLWKSHPVLASLQLLPRGDLPIAARIGDDMDRALTSVAEEIAQFPPLHQASTDDIDVTFPGDLQDPPSTDNNTSHLVDALEALLEAQQRDTASNQQSDERAKQIDSLCHQITSRFRPERGLRVANVELIKPLGSGNFGTIWLSRHVRTGELLATKTFHLEKLGFGLMLWRFRRSIRAMDLLTRHNQTPPTIVRLRSVAPSTLAFTMDYLAGGDLERVPRLGWSLERKLSVMIDVCNAVSFAHRLGVIHRDIKPSNVLIDDVGRPVLTDFDISDIQFVTKLSIAEGGLGTPLFAAPEQLADADSANERSDIYSLGRLLYFLLLERSPGFQVEEDPKLENLSTFPAALIAIVRRATQLKPGRRFVTVEQMRVELEQCQTGWATAKASVRSAVRWIRVNFAVLSILILVTSSALIVAVLQSRRAHEQEELAAAEASARLRSESLQQELADALLKLDRATERFTELEKQKGTVTEQISELDAELRLLLSVSPASPSERKRTDDRITALKAKLADLRTKQIRINEQVQQLGAELAEASRRAKALQSQEPPKNCGCQVGDIMCAMKCSQPSSNSRKKKGVLDDDNL